MTMTDEYVIPFDNTTVKGGDYGVLPEGTKVLVTVLPTRKDISYIEKGPYAQQGANTGITALRVRFRVSDGQRGQGRNIFDNIPLSRTFASGKPAYSFFGFFRALGYDVDAPEGFHLPPDHDLLGEEVELVLGVKQNAKGEDVNFPRFYNKANGIPANTAAPASKPKAAWHPGNAPAQPEKPKAQSPWSPPGADRQAHFQHAADNSEGF